MGTTGKTFGLAGYIGGTTKRGTTPLAAPFKLTAKATATATTTTTVDTRTGKTPGGLYVVRY